MICAFYCLYGASELWSKARAFRRWLSITATTGCAEPRTRREIRADIWRCVVPEGKFGGQVCALKVLREDQNMTEEDRHSFVREAHLLARMTSPYVLKALGGSETVDKLVMRSDGRHGRRFQTFLVVPFPLPYRQIKCTHNY